MKGTSLAFLLFAAAAIAARSNGGMRVSTGTNFALKVGQTAVVRPSGARIRFEDVIEDSRCPKGAMCVRAGNARIAVAVTSADGRRKYLELDTADGPKDAVCLGLRVALISLAPYPVVHQPIDRAAYTATLAASAAGK